METNKDQLIRQEARAFSREDMAARLSPWQKEGMRLSDCFHEVVFALKHDLLTHPWKFLFYTTPIPPFAGSLMLAATLIHFALGRSERIKDYRRNIARSINGHIHYERYRGFVYEDAAAPSAQSGEKGHLKIAWGRFANERWFQSRKYLLSHAVEWSDNKRDSLLNRSFRKTLIWDIKRMKKGSHGYLFQDLPELTVRVSEKAVQKSPS